MAGKKVHPDVQKIFDEVAKLKGKVGIKLRHEEAEGSHGNVASCHDTTCTLAKTDACNL